MIQSEALTDLRDKSFDKARSVRRWREIYRAQEILNVPMVCGGWGRVIDTGPPRGHWPLLGDPGPIHVDRYWGKKQ